MCHSSLVQTDLISVLLVAVSNLPRNSECMFIEDEYHFIVSSRPFSVDVEADSYPSAVLSSLLITLVNVAVE